MKKKEIRFRCWVDVNGVRFFGPGRAELLNHIQQSGSISKAAKEMGMSYKKAWAMVEEMNTLSSTPLVTTHKGGKKGGGTEVTDTGKKITAAYEKLADKIAAVVSKENNLLKWI